MNTPVFQIRFLVWLTVLWLFGPGHAYADDFATVTAISAPDTRGRWSPVKQTAAAAKVEADARTPLFVGMPLQLGDRVVTEEARVTIRLGKSEHVTLAPGGDLVLQERSVLQQIGDVYYQVRNAFTVQYGTVQTAVEGTEFIVGGSADAVDVAVTEGVVTVSNAGETVRVRRGQSVVAASGAAPTTPAKMPLATTRSLRSQAWTLSRPRVRLGVVANGGLYDENAGVEMRYFAAMRVLPAMNIVSDGGHALTPDSLRTGTGLGVDWAVGGFSLGGTVGVTVERWNYECGGRYAALHFGGSAHGRYSIDITRRLFLTGMARASANGSGIEASFGVGGGISL